MIDIETNIKQALQAISDCIDTHPFFNCNDLPLSKLDLVVDKIKSQYPDLERDKFYAYRLRKAGKASHRLIVYQPETDKDIEGFFVLLSSQMDENKKFWKEATNKETRLVVYGYELVKKTRPGASKPAWTWRINKTRFEKHKQQITNAVIQKKFDWLKEFAKSTKNWPGFSGVREQHFELKKHLYKVISQNAKKEAQGFYLEWPRLAYVTRRVYGKNKEAERKENV